jgi:hypothetical protein
MPRLKNLLQEKRAFVVATSGSVTYKIPMGAEKEQLGHFMSQEVVDGVLVIKFAIKAPPAVIEDKEIYEIKFN